MLVKRSSYLPSYINYLDDFFGKNFFENFSNENVKSTLPTANITENENDFQIELAAPGYGKDNFSIQVNQNVLSIKAEIKKDEESNQKQFARKEHYYASFERQFTLPETIKSGEIEASYKHGMLKVILPKKDEKELDTSKVIKIK